MKKFKKETPTKQEEFEIKLKTIGARLLDIVDGDPRTKGLFFWGAIYGMIASIEKSVPIEAYCFGCKKVKARVKGWKIKEIDEMSWLVCLDCSCVPAPSEGE